MQRLIFKEGAYKYYPNEADTPEDIMNWRVRPLGKPLNINKSRIEQFDNSLALENAAENVGAFDANGYITGDLNDLLGNGIELYPIQFVRMI